MILSSATFPEKLHVLVEALVVSLLAFLTDVSPVVLSKPLFSSMFFRFTPYKNFKLCTTPNGEVRISQREPFYRNFPNIFLSKQDAYRFIDSIADQVDQQVSD